MRLTQYLVKAGFFASSPLVILDGGVAGGFQPRWNVYGAQAELYGFDPNMKESHKGNQHIYPFALSDKSGLRTFYSYHRARSSSFYLPNPDVVSSFSLSSSFTVRGQQEIDVVTLDDFLGGGIDYIKMDVEGAEMDILRGAKKSLSSVIGLDMEIAFVPMRTGAAIFREVDAFLAPYGFQLFSLPRIYRFFRKTLTLTPYTENRGQALWGEVSYFQTKEQESSIQAMKAASLAEVRGFPSFAIEIVLAAKKNGFLSSDDARHYVDLLTPKVDGQIVSYKEYWKMQRAAVDITDGIASNIAHRYRKHWSKRIC